ncbi:MAG: hypothetical protein SPL61_09390 [Saccharofermentans sp.]|nr:hypothetical protein [Saccharofermentans sp.]
MDNNEKNFIRSCYLGLEASILALIFIFLCFSLIDYHLNPVYNLLVLLSLASPIVGLVFSLVGIIKTTQAEKKDIVAGSAGMTISILELLFIIIVFFPWLGTRTYLARIPPVIQPHSHNVEINNEDWERMELQRKGYPTNYPEVPLEENFHLTLEDDYTITRDDHGGFKNLGWVIKRNGKTVLERVAENELSLEPIYQWMHGEDGKFTIYLTAVVDGEYRRVSNIIEYKHFPSEC